jgi:hypothetical protein
MEQDQERKKYKGLMSEHERLVNDRDIKAYENMETNIYAKVPGFSQSHEATKQRQIMDRWVGMGQNGSP